MAETTYCVGCGCSDDDACVDEFLETCRWLRVDRDIGRGVCSACPERVEPWDAGARTLSGKARIKRQRTIFG